MAERRGKTAVLSESPGPQFLQTFNPCTIAVQPIIRYEKEYYEKKYNALACCKSIFTVHLINLIGFIGAI